jgi:hypothetical protein
MTAADLAGSGARQSQHLAMWKRAYQRTRATFPNAFYGRMSTVDH